KSGLHQHTIQMAIIIHGVLLGIFALSLTITLYALIFMRTTTSLSHVGGLEQLMKSVQEMNKLLPK
ncbi:MAG TPA: hypothetical protein PKD72_01470, partial [Gemmatales bacterium]|nr:hypothetical protein [Gemmatales bacterium]